MNPTLHTHTHCQVAQADTQTKTWRQRVPVQPHRRQTSRTTGKNNEGITAPIRKQGFRAS